MAEQQIGTVTHYFSKVQVSAIELSSPVRVGDRIRIRGHTTDLEYTMDSMEIDRRPVDGTGPGDDLAIKVPDKVRSGDRVYREMNGEGTADQ